MIRNILFVSHSAELNGSERMLLQTLNRIDRSKFYLCLLLPQPGPLGEEVKKLGIQEEIIHYKWWLTEKSKIWKQPFSWMWNIKSVFQICKIIHKRRISLVFSNSSVAFSGALAAKARRIPHVWSIHEILCGKNPLIYFFFGNRALVNLISCLSTRIIVNSSASQKAFKQRKKVRLVYNALEIGNKNIVPKNALREELGIGKKDFILGVVGKIYREKGQREVILAVDSIRRTYPHVKLLVVGGVKDQDYYLELKKLVKERNLEKHVCFVGYRKDIFNLLRSIDLLVVSSSVDSFGLAALEAMAVKTPVLAVRAGGLPEIISHGKNGFLIESRKPEIIQKEVESILKNPLKVAEVTEEGFRTARERFSLKEQVKEIEKVMDECFEYNRR